MCDREQCEICNVKYVLHTNNLNNAIANSLFSKISPIFIYEDLYDRLPEIRNIIVDYMCQIYIVHFNRPNFIDRYVGWSGLKTSNLLNNNRDKIIIVDNSHSLVNNKNDCFGKEATHVIETFVEQNNNVVIFT